MGVGESGEDIQSILVLLKLFSKRGQGKERGGKSEGRGKSTKKGQKREIFV